MMPKRSSRGFTLVEMAIVLVLVGLMLGLVFSIGAALLADMKSKEAIKRLLDVRAAVAQFKERYRFLPGDFPAANEIANISVDCKTEGSGVGDGNGLIRYGPFPVVTPSEGSCALDHLFKSGIYPSNSIPTGFGAIRLMSRQNSIAYYTFAKGGPPAYPAYNVRDTVRNVIVLEDIPCRVATAIDNALDDGDLMNTNGMVASLSGACADERTLIWIAVAL